MKKTKKSHEQYLNELYADMFSQEQAHDEFRYLCNKSRGNYTTSSNIINAYANHTLGSLLRKYDPVAFNSSFNEWK